MFGNYDLREFSIEMGELKISLERSGRHFVYRRELGDVVEKIIVASDVEIVINPVEPVNLPKNVTNFMLIEFERWRYLPGTGGQTFTLSRQSSTGCTKVR